MNRSIKFFSENLSFETIEGYLLYGLEILPQFPNLMDHPEVQEQLIRNVATFFHFSDLIPIHRPIVEISQLIIQINSVALDCLVTVGAFLMYCL